MFKSLSRVPRLIGHIKFPEKLKGTVVEKWAGYWKNLFIDYRQMLQDLRTDIQDEPKKAITYAVGLTVLGALAANNPTELDFKDNLRKKGNEIALVHEECLNPRAAEHLRFLGSSYNQGVIHYSNLGILSIMYTSELNDSCDLYKGHCSYIKPSIWNFAERIVDVGFMGRWWNLYIKMNNYDVNF